MTTRTELDTLLSSYENYIGTGNMKQAGRTLPKIIRALVAFVEERTPDHVEVTTLEEGLRQYFVDVEDASLEKIKVVLDGIKASNAVKACAPCDVSIPDNPDLIEEFKESSLFEKIEELTEGMEVNLDEPIEGYVDLEPSYVSPIGSSFESFLEEEGIDEVATLSETSSELYPPVVEVAPAPKTTKKPKTSTT